MGGKGIPACGNGISFSLCRRQLGGASKTKKGTCTWLSCATSVCTQRTHALPSTLSRDSCISWFIVALSRSQGKELAWVAHSRWTRGKTFARKWMNLRTLSKETSQTQEDMFGMFALFLLMKPRTHTHTHTHTGVYAHTLHASKMETWRRKEKDKYG